MIEIINVKKSYLKSNNKICILNGINYEFKAGKIYAIMGHSGSGKTTLLNIIGTIIDFDSGELVIGGKNVSNLNFNQKADIRNKKIGFVFQNYLLNNNLKAYENIMIPMLINKEINPRDRKKISLNLLDKVGLSERFNHYPKELSGGEQQRVAIARALANNPSIILADEPTGNLDIESEKKVLEIFQELKKDGKCIIIVSHNDIVEKYADYVLKINNGVLEENNEII